MQRRKPLYTLGAQELTHRTFVLLDIAVARFEQHMPIKGRHNVVPHDGRKFAARVFISTNGKQLVRVGWVGQDDNVLGAYLEADNVTVRFGGSSGGLEGSWMAGGWTRGSARSVGRSVYCRDSGSKRGSLE